MEDAQAAFWPFGLHPLVDDDFADPALGEVRISSYLTTVQNHRVAEVSVSIRVLCPVFSSGLEVTDELSL